MGGSRPGRSLQLAPIRSSAIFLAACGLLFGGGLIGLLATGMKLQLGPLLNGIVKQDLFVNSPATWVVGLLATWVDGQA